ncbi:methyl-accepting chemotaxis protein [Paenibacillus tengchongensis]|uniref:methyl-accepting chemotaxis protein n=1 Tax=Paenibacillus tengchongensis TaxID=2608684 RepID=UPI0016527D7A|nr:methyl-accepting chemotaxis protein [Paenibacillus tengchongensis]
MKQLKVKYKMTVLVAIAVIMLIILGMIGILNTDDMAKRSQNTYSHNLQPIYLVTEIRANNRMIESYLLEDLLTDDQEKTHELAQGIQSSIEKNNGLMEQLQQLHFSDSAIKDNINQYVSLLGDYRAQREAILQLAAKNMNSEGYRVFSGAAFSEARLRMTTLLDDTSKLLLADAEAQNKLNASSAASSRTTNSIIITAAWILIILISVVITRLITKPLRELQGLMKQAEAGDLSVTAHYNSRDEIGQINQSFNRMLGSLRTMMQGIAESAEMLSASSQEMSASSEQTARASQLIAETSGEIAAGFEVQAQMIGRTASSVKTMAEEMYTMERSGGEMAALMEEAAGSTERGAEAVELILDQMQRIDSSVSGSQDVVVNLGSLSQEINTIITTINEIATQTNLLSLNASIEAARAGEHGRGFAVVAGEIRQLAEATGKSSQRITEIITHIQVQTAEAVDAMAKGSAQVSDGVAHSGLVAKAFAEIQQSIGAARRQAEGIQQAIGYISRESQGVTEAMEEASRISRKGADDVQDTSAASEEQLSAMGEMSHSAQYLATLAENLQKELGRFKL